MPIKLPKSFARRKSSGNALEDVKPPVEPSFRVFERPHGSSKSFDGTSALQRLAGNQGETPVDDPYPDNIFAGIERPSTAHQYAPDTQPARARAGKLTGSTGSGGTHNSSSTSRLYDSSSSAKFSSSSTLPSDNSAHDLPVPPIPESSFASALRSAGRTFSFGTKAPRLPPTQHGTPRHSESTARERAMTTSTTSTATPPRLLESDLNLESSEDFSNIFDNIGKRKSQLLDSNSLNPSNQLSSSDGAPVPPKGSRPNGSSLLSPIHTHRHSNSIPAPSPSDSQSSSDGLIRPSSPIETNSVTSNRLAQQLGKVRFSDEDSRNPNQPSYSSGRSLTANANAGYTDASFSSSNATLIPNGPSPPALAADNHGLADPEVSSMYASDNDFTTIPLNHRNKQPTSALSNVNPVFPRQNEHSLSAEASLAARYEEVSLKNDEKPTKVMTPAQFERYRQQKEMTRRQSNASTSDSSGDDSEEEEEEDEAEKKRQAANQRKKQEAHLSVYRQQMMKITGEQAKLTNLESKRDSLESTGPSANPNHQPMLPADKAPAGKSGDGDDDDDVPLAILAAHGFPNKNRPPSQLLSSNSNPNLRSSYMLTPPSVTGDTPPPKRKTLPVFARNLPQDPYFGASLVNPPNRESFALGGGSPSVYGGPTPTVPPGGLVGMIANEERARAMRRGSPNAQVSFDMPNTSQGMNHLNPGGIGPTLLSQIGGQPNGIGPGDQSQIQVSQQMTQMMQMQIQWMQQMMQMQSMQLGQPMQMNNPNLLQPPGPMQRPVSMVSNMNALQPGPPQVDQRTLSMLDPSSAQWNRHSSFFPATQDTGSTGTNLGMMGNPGYAPSVAPSERSNVGAASRYRPVSTVQPPQPNRSSTFTASTPRPWLDEARNSTFTSSSPQPRLNHSGATIRPVSGLVTSAQNANDDDDDDEGWAEMAKAREKKKSGWRFKKGSSPLGDLFHSNQI
ncbi:hypothetical protein DIZ76_014958 [Coccidioides immitis]|uniref:Uncharacterized protein n=1 Tax=Coccidioides immitis RMSCC 2394 TaxID=404692 RepID=A0A0J6YAV7_COCIT|nr:hypothetical protein CIRG_05527 [Coccidioides immitis RMSCC 2394]TPX23076.1 hypothetical protein DIZ76_014958 [Coccidioides immitis]